MLSSHLMTREPPDSSDGLTADELFHILADDRRRATISLLATVEGSVELASLAERILDERGDGQSAEEEQALRVYMSLYHSHIPKMEEAGLVSYSQHDDTVSPTDGLDDAIKLLRLVATDSERASRDGN